jgi:hypothetical protein
MKAHNPRSPADMKEEEMENEFLNESSAKQKPSNPH